MCIKVGTCVLSLNWFFDQKWEFFNQPFSLVQAEQLGCERCWQVMWRRQAAISQLTCWFDRLGGEMDEGDGLLGSLAIRSRDSSGWQQTAPLLGSLTYRSRDPVNIMAQIPDSSAADRLCPLSLSPSVSSRQAPPPAWPAAPAPTPAPQVPAWPWSRDHVGTLKASCSSCGGGRKRREHGEERGDRRGESDSEWTRLPFLILF